MIEKEIYEKYTDKKICPKCKAVQSYIYIVI